MNRVDKLNNYIIQIFEDFEKLLHKEYGLSPVPVELEELSCKYIMPTNTLDSMCFTVEINVIDDIIECVQGFEKEYNMELYESLTKVTKQMNEEIERT